MPVLPRYAVRPIGAVKHRLQRAGEEIDSKFPITPPSTVIIEVFRLDIQAYRVFGRETDERPIALVGLGDEIFAAANLGVVRRFGTCAPMYNVGALSLRVTRRRSLDVVVLFPCVWRTGRAQPRP